MTNEWIWTYSGYDPPQEGLRESLCALGNGYQAVRGVLSHAKADAIHYPGTYIADVYNRLQSVLGGRTVEDESIVNIPNWLYLTFTTPDGEHIDVDNTGVIDHHLELDIRRAVLTRRTLLDLGRDRQLGLTERRFVSLRDRHLAGTQTTIVAHNWSGPLSVCTAIDGTVTNSGVARYEELENDHLVHVIACEASAEAVSLEVETNDSHIRIAQTARTTVTRDGEPVATDRLLTAADRWVDQTFSLDLEDGRPVTIDKVVTTFTSRDDGIYEPHKDATYWALEMAGDFDELLERHALSWRHAWDRSRIQIQGAEPRTAAVLNLHILHLLQTVSKNAAELDAGVPARGLHGEAYRGHIFWDELFIFPFLNWRVPELTRSLLRYRARRLDLARDAASKAGYSGAMYPWQSASNGREETPSMHLNPRSGRWLPDISHRQRHVNIAVAYNVWAYWQATRDLEFMRFWGVEMLIEIARFWASIATYEPALDRFQICGVMGPDEYHDHYPWSDEPGIDNNAYTNVMAVWCIERAFEALEELPSTRAEELRSKLHLESGELDRWGDVARKMRLCFHGDRILSQFEHYDDLDELDWGGYAKTYGNVQRMDRILEAEGDTTNRFKLAKQPDVLMLLYLLSADELAEIFDQLGYELDPDFIRRNIEYYEQRTSHGSTLSKMIHAWVLARLDRDRSWELLRTALLSDVEDHQGGTTAEGIHLGAMAGTVDLVQRCYTGLETRGDRLLLNPALPAKLGSIAFGIRYRGHLIELSMTHDETRAVEVPPNGEDEPIVIEIGGETHELTPGNAITVHTGDGS